VIVAGPVGAPFLDISSERKKSLFLNLFDLKVALSNKALRALFLTLQKV
jgi:hypothetical protein